MDDQLATQLASAMTSIAPGSYRTDATTASATFTVKEKLNLLTVPGQIPVVRADVAIDADGLPRGTATLDVAAITTPNTKRDRDLQGRRFFDTATFPIQTVWLEPMLCSSPRHRPDRPSALVW